MSTPPQPNTMLNRSLNRFDFAAAVIPFQRKQRIIREIGEKDLKAFETWAFPKVLGDMIYNDEITFHWNNGHSTKGMPLDPDKALEEIIRLWNERFVDSLQINEFGD